MASKVSARNLEHGIPAENIFLEYRKLARIVAIIDLCVSILIAVCAILVMLLVFNILGSYNELTSELVKIDHDEDTDSESERNNLPTDSVFQAIFTSIIVTIALAILPISASVALLRATSLSSERSFASKANHANFWIISTLVFIALCVLSTFAVHRGPFVLIWGALRLIFLYFVIKYKIELKQHLS